MNAKKRKAKERRRARKLADQAWDAVDSENLDLAEKLIRRAVATQSDNPELWHDQGIILGLRGNESEAEQSFRATLSLAPDFADAYARLAAIHVRRGRLTDAVALQEQAVVHAPEVSDHWKRLESYRSLTGQAETQQLMQHGDSSHIETAQRDSGFDEAFVSRLAEFDWSKLAASPTRSQPDHIRHAVRPRATVSPVPVMSGNKQETTEQTRFLCCLLSNQSGT